MRKNGFTLIELLAVIVILAIIALIATPIILGIINDAREKANERSVELYASAVRNGIAAYQLREGKEVEAKTYKSSELDFVEYDGNVVCESVIISEDGKVSLEGCKVNNGTKEYSYGIEEDNIVAKVCTIEKQDESKYSKGDIVTCNIGETPEKFYVIADTELTASTIQMLTEKNLSATTNKQSDNPAMLVYSGNPYWLDENGNLLSNYGTTYPANVFDDNSNLYQFVSAYESYLKANGISDASATLINPDVLEDLGCVFYGTCDNAPSWVYSSSYWTGYATDSSGGVMLVTSTGIFADDYCSSSGGPNNPGNLGIRPVITIPISEIQ